MRRLGAAVTAVERSSRLLPREDPDVSDGIRAILEAEGVRFELGAECLCLAPAGDRIVVGAACGGDEGITGSHVLMAVGRQPNTDGPGLERADIRTDDRGYVEVDHQCRTSAEGVWAMGDCNGRGALTHTAWNDHEIVVASLFDDDPRPQSRRDPGIHEGAGRRRHAAHHGCSHPRQERRRGGALAARHHGGRPAVHRHLAGHAHPSGRERTGTDLAAATRTGRSRQRGPVQPLGRAVHPGQQIRVKPSH